MPSSVLISGTGGEMIECTPGTFVGTGAITVAAIVKVDSSTVDGTTRYAVGLDVNTGNTSGLGIEGSPAHWFFFDGTGANVGPDVPAADEWYLIAVSKATGNVTLRFHVYRYSTYTWTHTNGSASNNISAPARLQLGSLNSEQWEGGNLLVVGAWDSELSDGTIQTLVNSKTAWINAAPKEAWRLDSLTPDNFVGTGTQGTTFGTPTLDVGDAPPGWGDYWSKVQSNTNPGGTGGNPRSTAFSSNVTAGNLLLAYIQSDSATMTMGDNTGHNTWRLVKAQADSGNDQKGALWYAIAQQSEACATLMDALGGFRGIIIEEWARSGAGSQALALDTSASNSSTSQFPATPSLSPTAANALVVAMGMNNASNLTALDEVEPPFFFQEYVSLDNSVPTQENQGAASYEQTIPASVSTNWNYGASGQSATIIASFNLEDIQVTFKGSPRRGLASVA